MANAGHTTKEAAQGRWRDILLALGIDRRLLNGKHQSCPRCGGKDRFRYDDKRGDGGYICSQCGAGTGFGLLQLLKGWDFKAAAHEVDMVISNLPAGRPAPVKIRRQATRDVLNDLWRSSFPIRPEDPVGVYLAARRLTLDAACKALRYFPLLPHHPTATWHPGLLALFSDASGQAKQIQRTYLTEQGSKADIIPNRMFMPGEMPVGGAIRLGPPAETMGVTEGVETALAASQRFGMVVWATTSEVLLQKWVPPPEARRIIVFGDNDASFVGQRAAYTLAARLVHEAVRDKVECEIEVRIPEATGTDWADQ